MKIVFVIQGLTVGGAERNLLQIANSFAEVGDAVTILTFDEAAAPAFPVDNRVTVKPLAISLRERSILGKIRGLFVICPKLRAAIDSINPDIVISFMDQVNILTLLALMRCRPTNNGNRMRYPVIVSERSHPEYSSLLWNRRIGFVREAIRWFRAKTYEYARAVVVQTERAKTCFPPSLQSRLAVIPNAAPAISRTPGPRDRCVLAVGRLVPEKRFDLLITAFDLLRRENPEWRLKIVGEGPLRPQLQTQIERLGMQSCATLSGSTPNVGREFERAGVFALTSDMEGFPTVILEAMAHGAPVIASDCEFGPREIIRDRTNGLLFPRGDSQSLSRLLHSMINDASLRNSIANEAETTVRERFSSQSIFNAWRSLAESACSYPQSNHSETQAFSVVKGAEGNG